MSPFDTSERPMPRWDVYDYVEAVLRRPWYVLVCFLLISAGVTVYSLTLSNKYRSYTLIMVESDSVPAQLVTQTPPSSSQRIANVRQEILSRTRLERIIRELNPYPDMMKTHPMMDIVETMRNRIHIRVRGADAFLVEFVHTQPEMTMNVTSRLATLFIDETTKAREKQAGETRQFIESQLQRAGVQLKKMEDSLRRYKQKNMGALPQQLGANLNTLQALQMELQTVNQSLQAAESRKMAVEQNLAREIQRVRASMGATGTVLPLETELAQARNELAALRSRYTAEHPDVRRLRAQVRELVKQLTAKPSVKTTYEEASTGIAATDPIVSGLRTQLQDVNIEIKTLKTRRSDIEQKTTLYRARVQRTPQVEEGLTAQTRDYSKMQDNYLTLLTTKLDAQQAEQLEKHWKGEIFKMLDPAFLPERPYFPDRKLFVLSGAVLGLLTGLGAALLRERLDASVKNARELEALVGSPVLVRIPRVGSQSMA